LAFVRFVGLAFVRFVGTAMCASVAAPRNTVVGIASSTGADDKCQFDHTILPVHPLEM
jgi:hypothetical protein